MSEQVFVARERELAQVQTFLDQALAGQGQVCFVTGEAGAGKTALVIEFARRAQAQHSDLLVAIGDCNAQIGIGDPYLPFREILAQLTGDVETKLTQGAMTQENAGRLRDFLRVSGQVLVDLGPDLIDIVVPGVGVATRAGTLLAGKVGWLDRLDELSERQARRAGGPGLEQSRIFEQYTDVLRALAAQQPLLLVLDDLQWVDKSSVSLLFHLGRRIEQSRMLIVGTYRPNDVALGRGGERHPLEPVLNEFKRYFGDVWVNLEQAEAAEGRQFVDALLDTEPNRLGAGFRQALYQHTGGHPLFTVELLRDLQERGDLIQDQVGRWVEGPALDLGKLPARVEGVIAERIGRLEEELRETLTVASVEGEDFTAQVVARVQALDERGLVRRLSGELEKQHRLVRERGIKRLGTQRLSRYRFQHNLFQKYLYNSLGEAERAYLHEDVGNVLEALYETQTGEIAGQLARHFEEAGLPEKAVEYRLQAGQDALRLSAHQEAITHLRRGLEQIERLPETADRAPLELDFQTALGAASMATKGYAAPEVEQAYARARELCQQVGDTPQLIPVMWGMIFYYVVRADYRTARELAEQLQRVAERENDAASLLASHAITCNILFWLGEFSSALEHAEHGMELYDQAEHSSLISLYGQDLGVTCLSFAGYALGALGYPDQALARVHAAQDLAEALSHPFSQGVAGLHTASVHFLRREALAAQTQCEALIALSKEQGFPFWSVAATAQRGWALAMQGRIEEGIAQIREGLAGFQATGARHLLPFLTSLPAEAHGEIEQFDEGLALVTEALGVVDKTDERWYEAELHRLKGELLLRQRAGRGSSPAAPTDEAGSYLGQAESCFQHAIEVARRQQAKWWELRATVSLCRLLQQQGRGEEGRQMLADIHGWFTEGFDTPDLLAAKELLAQLSN